MGISHRGLLASGLAVVVVGALGVASTMAAQADQIPAAPDPGASTAAPPHLGSATPPVLLPWGARPARIKTGRAGADSDTLRAEGLVAAGDEGGSLQPTARYAPKGRIGPTTTLKSEAVPPAPNATTAAGKIFLYNYGSQTSASDGLFANVSIAKPTLGAKDFHTLAELAVQSADSNQIVEVGWNVDPSVNGDTDPHLFVYHWINGAETCYNACGFVQSSATVKPGATLTYGVAKRFGIQFSAGAWWISFDSEFIGSFPETLWTSQGVASFNRTGFVQTFGEVAASSTAPCTQMGNGLLGTNAAAAVLGSISYTNGPTVALTVKSNSDVYAVNALSTRTFQYGGPGASSC